MNTWIDAMNPSAIALDDPKTAHLIELAADVGSNLVVLRNCASKEVAYQVDGLTFGSIDAAIRHCKEVA